MVMIEDEGPDEDTVDDDGSDDEGVGEDDGDDGNGDDAAGLWKMMAMMLPKMLG